MKNIAIICGGNSGEYEVSVASGETVLKNLDPNRYKGYLIVIRNKNWFFDDDKGNKYEIDKTDFSLRLGNEIIQFDGIFNAIHGTPGEDGKLQGYFDIIGLPYTSCNQSTSALTFNKYFCNRFVSSFGIKTAESVSLYYGEKYDKKQIIERLGLPLFVKPAESGSSVGITKVNMEAQLDEAIAFAFSEGDRILIEENLKGREITCGVINKGKDLIVLPLTEIISKKEFFDYEAKYTKGMSEEPTPANVNEEVEQDVKTISAFLYRRLDCKGFVRFDYILTDTELYFLEVNTIPGITEASIVPKMVKAFGIPISEFFNIALNNLFEGQQ
jgi:D-alanine-D-alanine ligase